MREPPRLTYEPHALEQMADRGVTTGQVERALETWHTSYPAEPLPHTLRRATIFVATIDQGELKVYIEQDRTPPNVLTVAWKD